MPTNQSALSRRRNARQALHISIILIFLLGPVARARITKGPVLLRVYQRRAALMWETDTKGPGSISYGKGLILNQNLTTKPDRVEYQTKKANAPAVGRSAFIHKVWLDGLETGTSYSYCAAGPQDKSRVYQFRTVPANTEKARFAVYGDNRTVPQQHRKVVEQIIKAKVDFVVNSGDLVTKGDIYEQWGPQFFEPLKDLAETVPIYVAKGNHDKSRSKENFRYFERLLVPAGEENNFGFDYGPVHYFCADNVTSNAGAEQLLELIVKNIQQSRSKWKFVSYHIPSLNFGGHWSTWCYPRALPKLAAAGIDFVVTGHSHVYERFWPVAPPERTKRSSYVTYITSGGGGAPTYSIRPGAFLARTKRIRHFCLFSIDGDKLTMDTISADGEVIDHIELNKTNGRLNESYLQTAVPMELVSLHQNLFQSLSSVYMQVPQKGRPFGVTYELSNPTSIDVVKATLSFRDEEGTYQLGKSKTVAIPKAPESVCVKLTAMPLAKVKAKAGKSSKPKPLRPALWIDCHYETTLGTGRLSWQVYCRP